MKRAFYFILLSLFIMVSCGGGSAVKDDPVKNDKPDRVVRPAKAPSTGWSDADTYTVRVSAISEEKAKGKARHKILKDIVNVRVLNGSRYTDITKIVNEFDKPLKGGKVIQKNSVPGGVEIYFQIRDQGLKKKFERK